MIADRRVARWCALGALLTSSACAPREGAVPADTARGTEVRGALRYDPSRDIGPLFADVQGGALFPDSKTFVDMRPRVAPDSIAVAYAATRTRPGFSLAAFVDAHFTPPETPPAAGDERSRDLAAHLRAMWPRLTRPADAPTAVTSLLPLPSPYIVPGGRFREVYYWDSYFTMLGLLESGDTTLVRQVLDNFAHLVRTVGHVPNGNRTYYLSRSQPPFFAAMVGRYATATDTTRALRYLDALEAEHAFWMEGAESLRPGTAHRRVVRDGNGYLFNRYWDDRPEPRPESWREDHALGESLPDTARESFYRHVRAAAESGWDFSSRWMRDTTTLASLETTALIPVDLNSILYHTERTIAALRRVRARPGDLAVAARFDEAAMARAAALRRVAYDSAQGFFFDVRWQSGERVTDRPTLAAAVPVYFGVADAMQARAVATRLARDFLAPGGFVTTKIRSGQQWDAPNGWAPLQWMAIAACRLGGQGGAADEATRRWLALNARTYAATGRMMEKYDVLDLSRAAGGGEYPTQDGFGWTNGVALALLRQQAGASAAARPH
ncbi:MAG: alpha,alpha-trehalase TreF [Gemmatimonadaceae bacterium]|nr:alpha,alpha-trehalase TreF [Gemmatimonadaceae bacterium]